MRISLFLNCEQLLSDSIRFSALGDVDPNIPLQRIGTTYFTSHPYHKLGEELPRPETMRYQSLKSVQSNINEYWNDGGKVKILINEKCILYLKLLFKAFLGFWL
jgi:hypothetical protein